MSATTDISGANLWYRIKHDEFLPDYAYKAYTIETYAESAWRWLIFINERGMTYGTKVKNTLNLNAIPGFICEPGLQYAEQNNKPYFRLTDPALLNHPMPKPKGPNKDLEED